MFLSPPEIKQQQLREKKGAYERQDVDTLLDNVVGSYQHVWLERDRLKARVEELEQEIANTKELEKLLREGLASAQRAAEQVKQEAEAQVSGLVEEARTKADAIVAEANAKAEEIVADSRVTRDRLEEETTRLQKANHDVRERYKAFLLEALSVVEGTAEHRAVQPQAAAAAEADESAPVPEPKATAEPEPEAAAERDAVLEGAGWLATVPLVAVTADSVDESVAENVPEPAPEAAAEPAPEPEPEAQPAASVFEEEEEVPATVLLSAVTETSASEPEPEAPAAPEAVAEREPEPQPEPVADADAEPEPTEAEAEPARVADAGPEPAPDAEAEPEPQPEPEAAREPEPEPETLAPEEAYMTYRGLSAVTAEDPPQAASAPESEEDTGEDAYEDWTPRRS